MRKSRCFVLALATAATTLAIVAAGSSPANAVRKDGAVPKNDPNPVIHPDRLSIPAPNSLNVPDKATHPGKPLAERAATAAIGAAAVRDPGLSSSTACLTKQYLPSGYVLFRDVCTNESAVHSNTVATRIVRVATRACLIKETLSNGVVLFRDICSHEWAMTPSVEQG